MITQAAESSVINYFLKHVYSEPPMPAQAFAAMACRLQKFM